MPELIGTVVASARDRLPYDPASVVRHIASEVKQPLSTIESIAHYLNMVLPRTEAKARRQLRKLEEELHHIQWVLTDTLHLLQAAPTRPQLLDLTEVVSKDLDEWCPEQAAGCSVSLAPGLPLVSLDLTQIEHLLRNLTTFFRRLSAPGRTVSIQTYAVEGTVFLEFASASLRYVPEDIEPLLEPLQDCFLEGPGLPLASARRIVEAHGGSIAVESSPPALRVTVSFPGA